MLIILLILIFIRPFICGLASPILNYLYSISLAIFLIFWFIYKGLSIIKLQPLKYPLGFFCLALIISLAFSQNKLNSFDELYKYISGLSLFVIAASLEDKNKTHLIYTIIISAVIISFIAIYQYLFGFQQLANYIVDKKNVDPFVLDYIEQKRVFFPFVTPNILGGYLAMIIPLCLIIKNGIWFIIPIFAALFLTKSIGAILTLSFGLAVYFFLRKKVDKKGVLIILGLLIILALIFILRSAIQKEHTRPLFSLTARLNYWKDALGIIKTHYLTGVGPGNFNLPQCRYAHNSYLQLLAEMGILGIISFFWLVISVFKLTFKNLMDSQSKAQIAALITASIIFLAHNLVDFSLFLPEVAFIWWVITGMLISF
jgi:O-antigen ligase